MPGGTKRALGVAFATLAASVAVAVAPGGGDEAGAAKKRPAPRTVTTLRGEGYDVAIRRTSYGIPHVIARDWDDLGYGYGFSFARDNICTAADSYVTARGERSRFFGEGASYRFEGNGVVTNNLNSDFFYRRFSDNRTVERLLDRKPPHGPRPEIREAVRGYVAGYNRYLRDTGVDKLPDQTCRGKPWVRPLEEIDAYRRFYQLALLASGGVAIDGIGGAQPLTPALGGQAAMRPSDAPPGLFDLGGLGSNAYGLGREATQGGGGMVLGNPHFPWQGSERFYQSQLTIPGKLDVAGGSLFGVPIVLIGHTRKLAWSHTVSTARRFTPFELKLVPGSPTTYLYDGRPREMKREPVTVEVKGGGKRTRTLYSSHQGPILTSILGLPIFPWNTNTAYALGDVNAPNFRYLNHFFETNKAQSVRELDTVLRRNQGIPWVNTIAADSSGEAYYADIGAIPHVTDEKAADCNTPEGQATNRALRVPILDGSRSACEWGNDPDALQPGSFGPKRMPHLFRNDYVTNSNDSYWLSNPKQPLEGFDLIIGDEGTARALRTRLGLIMVQQRMAGSDGLPGRGFTLPLLQDVAFNNRVYSGELLRDETVRMCEQTPDVADACPVLRAWNVKDDLDSRGSVLWRRFATRALASPGGVVPPPAVFSRDFDRRDPVNTPSGLNTENPNVRQALRDAVNDLRSNGIPLDARLREYQSEQRGRERIPIHGGPHGTGVFNVITAAFRGKAGFPDVNHGSSFVMAAEMKRRGCPESRSILTYSQAATDVDSPFVADQTRLYSGKRWVDMRFCAEEILRDDALRVTEIGCLSTPGLRAVAVRGRTGRIRFGLRRRIGMPVSVDVLRGGRMVARFKRSRSFVSRKRLRGGWYVARFRVRTESGKLDERRVAFRVRRGRISRGPRFSRAESCGTLRSFALGSPTFRRSLRVSYRLSRRARVSIEVLRGRRVVRRLRARPSRTRHAQRLTVRKLGRGTHRVRITVRVGKRRQRATLAAIGR